MCHPAIENKTNVLWDKLQQLSCSPDAVDCRVLNREWPQTQGACCWHTDAGENVVMGLKAVNVTTSPTVACNARAMMPNAHNHVSNNPSQVVVKKPALIIMTTGSLTCDGPGDDSEESRSHRLVPELHPSLGWTSGPPGSKDIKSTIEENTCYKKKYIYCFKCVSVHSAHRKIMCVNSQDNSLISVHRLQRRLHLHAAACRHRRRCTLN